MMWPCLLLSLVGVVARPQSPAGIVGGKPTLKGELPWITNRYLRCGGALIHPSWVLTAAHCAYAVGDTVDYNRWNLSAAETGAQGTVALHVRHPQFNSEDPTGEFDLALLRFTQPAREASPAKLANVSQEALVYPGALFSVAGWGAVREGGAQSPVLRVAQLPILSNSKCSDNQHYGLIKRIFPSQICAGLEEGGRDSCAGDSGSPMFRMIDAAPVVFGVVSWGVGCGRPLRPGVYTRVSAHRTWILEQLRQYGDDLGVASCGGQCGESSEACHCDPLCLHRKDCCSDYQQVCAVPVPAKLSAVAKPPPLSDCKGRCDNKTPLKFGFSYCWCDSECLVNGDCCDSFRKECIQGSLFSQFFTPPTPAHVIQTLSPAPISPTTTFSSLFASFFAPSSPSPALPAASVSWSSLPTSLSSFLLPYFAQPASLPSSDPSPELSSSTISPTSTTPVTEITHSTSTQKLPNVKVPKWADYDYDVLKPSPKPGLLDTSKKPSTIPLQLKANVTVVAKLVERPASPDVPKQALRLSPTAKIVPLSSRLVPAASSILSNTSIGTSLISTPKSAPSPRAKLLEQPKASRSSCVGFCKGRSSGGCWCDASCSSSKDCCPDAMICFPG